MKTCLTISLLLLSGAGCSIAQERQGMAGLRQGISLWLTRTGIGQGTLKYAAGQHFTWDKEIFYRAKRHDKWVYEGAFSYYHFNNSGHKRNGPSYTERNDIMAAALSLQYDVTYPLLGYMFYSMQGMRACIGFEALPALSFNKQTLTDSNVLRKDRSTDFSLMIGFSYTHVVPISKRINMISKLAFHTNSFSKYQTATDGAKRNRRISLLTGIGYSL